MINRKFLNFKTYNGFLAKKNEIPEDSIVFIQEKPCIWARGKEYICDGPSTASVERNTLTFKNGNDKVIFKFQQKDGTITIEDSEGNKSSATYVLKDIYDGTVTNIYDAITNIQEIAEGYVLSEELADVAFSGSYTDLINTPDPITIDSSISSKSTNPVLNKAIYNKLKTKADKTQLDDYVDRDTYDHDMPLKQGVLNPRDGIRIDPNGDIWCTLDTNVYEFVTTRPDETEANPNKIYILEVNNGDGTYRYIQYRLRNGEWVSFDMVLPQIDLSLYEKAADAYTEHQAIRSLISNIDLTPYAKIEEHINPILDSIEDIERNLKNYIDTYFQRKDDYATKDWVRTYFVQKELVYHPKQGEWGTNETSEGGGGQLIITIVQQPIEVDTDLDPYSHNPVQNDKVTLAIYDLRDNKVDVEDLENYATKQEVLSKVDSIALGDYATKNELETGLSTKQNILRPGSGIDFVDGLVICTLDTDVFVFVTGNLPSNPSPNKIYIKETILENSRYYAQWRWDADLEDWIELGSITPDINLSGYLLESTADNTYLKIADANFLPRGNYATTDELLDLLDWSEATYQRKGEYLTEDDRTAIMNYVYSRFQRKGDYALSSDVTAALTALQVIIDLKYVLKKDVYNPNTNTWSSSDPTQISIGSGSGSSELGSGSAGSNMMTLPVQEYEDLVARHMVDENTYYFTYEPEEEPETPTGDSWHFGDEFPIILTDNWAFGGTFPITLR